MASRWFFFATLCSLALNCPGYAAQTSEKMNGLLNNSPFGLGRSSGVANGGTNDPLEFRAVLEEDGKRYYSIYETSSHRSTWVEINETVNGFSVIGYDAAHDTVRAEFHGKSLSLPIKRAAPVAQIAAIMPGAVVPNQVNQPGPTSVDQQRLQQVQEEIRRRRALRQQAPQPGALPGLPGGPQPMQINPNEPAAGPQFIPPNPGNNQNGPMPVPNKP
jgi:hypothetical protein